MCHLRCFIYGLAYYKFCSAHIREFSRFRTEPIFERITKQNILPFHMQPVESLSDDFLFPMTTSRLSYASSPESDLELSPGPSASLSLGNLPQLVKSNSDPSIATNQDNLDRDRELGELMPPPYTVRSCCSWLQIHPYHSTSYVFLIKMVFCFIFYLSHKCRIEI